MPLDNFVSKTHDTPTQHLASDVLNSIQLVMKNKTNTTTSLLKVLSAIDPAQIAQVTTLVEGLLSASENDLLVLQEALRLATGVFDVATNKYNAAVAEQVRLEELIVTTTAELESQKHVVRKAADVLSAATGAKESAQNTLDSESARLDSEISTLKQVIALLKPLDTSSWTLFEGSYYLFESTPRDFAGQRQFCQSVGGDVVSIHSAAEDNFITSLGDVHIYIGGRDLVGDNVVYTWVDGTPWSYSNWRKDEPNGKHEQCVNKWSTQYEAKWNDIVCTWTAPVVCKRRS